MVVTMQNRTPQPAKIDVPRATSAIPVFETGWVGKAIPIGYMVTWTENMVKWTEFVPLLQKAA